MCGIAGELRFQAGSTLADWKKIGDLMQRRGPDDSGLWDEDGHCTLAFRRLSILDLSEKGHQPMVHSSGQYVLVFNGEIYNFREIRSKLEARGEHFESSGDSEVLLKALITWGIDALKLLNGIFAFAFYDCQNKTILLARDHAGIKPLYLLRDNRGIVFASQFNQLLSHPWSKQHKVNEESVRLYLTFGYIPAPYGFLSGSSMLEPASWIRIASTGKIDSGTYWRFPEYDKPLLSGAEAIEAVDESVSSAVRRQLISDVPVGAFLSGGVDSPLIVANMAEANNPGLCTYTIATDDPSTDESSDATRYATELGVPQIVEKITPNLALSMLPDVIEASSEPFGDYSIFPTMLVSRIASENFKVMLSGDGGDELFWGYPQRSAELIYFANVFCSHYAIRRLRSFARILLGRGPAENLSYRTLGEWYQTRHTFMKRGWLHKVFPDIDRADSHFHGYEFAGCDADETAQWIRSNEFRYHLTMVLLKVDRASMHFSQEVRVPLLDKQVIETAAQIDWKSCLSLGTGIGKLPLRESLAKHVSYQTQAKRGFEAPMSDWLRGPLREKFETLVLTRDDFFGQRIHKNALNTLFSRHLSGQEDHARNLWPLLSLALWEQHHLRS